MSVSQPTDGDGLDGAEPEELVKILETQNTFNEFVVWGHEVTPAADDAFVKGVEEWIRFAETVCSSSLCIGFGVLTFLW